MFAYVGTRGLTFQTPLTPGRRLPDYELLWDVAFAGGWPAGRVTKAVMRVARSDRVGRASKVFALKTLAHAVRHRRPQGDHQVVKSVRALMSLEWIAERYRPRVVVVWRNPLNMLGTYLDLDWETSGILQQAVRDRFEGTQVWPPPAGEETEKAAWGICARLAFLLETVGRHPDWRLIRHESLSADPVPGCRAVLADLEIPWGAEVEAFLESSNRPGTRWETSRVSAEEGTAWKRRLTPDQVRMGSEVMRRFAGLPQIGAPFARCLEELV